MQRMAFFLVLFSLFYSCQPLDIEETEAGTIPQIGDDAWESRALTSDEIQLARKFCRALESKEIAYRRDYIGQELNFNLQYETARAILKHPLLKQSLLKMSLIVTSNLSPPSRRFPFGERFRQLAGKSWGIFASIF